jgi:hypothetical protein
MGSLRARSATRRAHLQSCVLVHTSGTTVRAVLPPTQLRHSRSAHDDRGGYPVKLTCMDHAKLPAFLHAAWPALRCALQSHVSSLAAPSTNRISNIFYSKHTLHLLLLNPLLKPIVRLLPRILIIEQQSLALSRENTRNPTILVRHAPHRHANALLDRQTCLGHVGPDSGLRRHALGAQRRRVQSDVELRVRDVDAQVGGGAQRSNQSGGVGRGAGVAVGGLRGQVALVADAVDVDAVRLDQLDDADGTGGFGAVVFDVVVVVCGKLASCDLRESWGDVQKRRALGAYFLARRKAMGMKASPMVS